MDTDDDGDDDDRSTVGMVERNESNEGIIIAGIFKCKHHSIAALKRSFTFLIYIMMILFVVEVTVVVTVVVVVVVEVVAVAITSVGVKGVMTPTILVRQS